MLDQNTFTETIREVSEIIRTAAEPLSREEILSYFHKMDLNEKQQEMVLEYLLKPENGAVSHAEEESKKTETMEKGTNFEAPGLKADEAFTDSRILRMYMEDALVMLRPVQNQVVVKTLPGLAQSFGAILDALELQEIVATICGDDVCLVICEDNQGALDCFEKLKEFTPPFFFSK